MNFVQRTTKPTAGNKYYIRKVSGGWSTAIKGNPTDSDCDVLSNCVGYAIGRFNEIGGYGSCKHLKSVDAENFLQFKGNLESGDTPKVGACMVWQSGPTLSGANGCGHVAIVKEVISDTEVVTSESAWGGAAFKNVVRKKGSDGKWGMGSGYKFLGFIYNPAPCCKDAGTNAATGSKTANTNVIYKSLGTAAKRKGTSTGAAMDSRCERGGYYAASQLVTPADGNQQWFRHAGTDFYSALTDIPAAGNAKLFEEYGTYTVGKTNAVVNVRTTAGLSGKALTKLDPGVNVYLTNSIPKTVDKLTWVEIVYDGKLAWCDKQWISC